MNIKLENPKDIYDKINIELLKLVTSLSLESSDESLHSTLWVDESEPYVFTQTWRWWVVIPRRVATLETEYEVPIKPVMI